MDTHWFSCTTLAIHGNSDLAQLYQKGHMGPLLIVRLHCLVPHISHLVSLLFASACIQRLAVLSLFLYVTRAPSSSPSKIVGFQLSVSIWVYAYLN